MKRWIGLLDAFHFAIFATLCLVGASSVFRHHEHIEQWLAIGLFALSTAILVGHRLLRRYYYDDIDDSETRDFLRKFKDWGALAYYDAVRNAIVSSVKHFIFKPDKPLRLLKAFRWFLPPQMREDLDIVIADLEEDVSDMKMEKRSRHFIFTVLLWHLIRTVSAYLWSGTTNLLTKVLPFIRYYSMK